MNKKIILTGLLSGIILLSPLAQAALSKEKLQELITKEEIKLIDFHEREQPYLKAHDVLEKTKVTEFVMFRDSKDNNLYSTFKVTNNSDYVITRAVPVSTLSYEGQKDRSVNANIKNIAAHSSVFVGQDESINKIYQSIYNRYQPSEIKAKYYIDIIRLDVDGVTIELTDGDTSRWRSIREYIAKSEADIIDYKKQLAELN